MILLHQYPAVYGLTSLSPFCIKVETYLKLVRLPYKIETEINPLRGPKGKMPFIEDAEQIGDTPKQLNQGKTCGLSKSVNHKV